MNRNKLLVFFTFLFFSQTSFAQIDYILDFSAGDKIETLVPFTDINSVSQFTFEIEVVVSSLTSWTHIMSKIISPTDRVSLQLHSGKVYCIVANGSNTYKYTTSPVITPGQKYQIAFVYNGNLSTKIKLYVDGVQQTLTSSAGSIPNTTPSNNALFKIAETSNFVGQIDEVRVWNIALSAYRINNWKDTTITSSHPEYGNLKLYWNFNDYTSSDTAFACENTTYDGIISGATYLPDTSNYQIPIHTLMPPDTIVGGYLPYYKIDDVSPEIFDHLTHLSEEVSFIK